MPQKIRMWEITQDRLTQDKLTEITSSEIDLEKRLEDWLVSDISMLESNLMVIGRQVRTDFGGEIDLLCLDSTGSLVVVELKKGLTRRDVAAQSLDYASWARGQSSSDINKLAEKFLGYPLEEAFKTRFATDLPDTLNESHRSLIVAAAMDEGTERIVRYLSDMGVPINVVTVQYFKSDDGRETIAQVVMRESEVNAPPPPNPPRRPYVNARVMETVADEKEVGDLYRHLRERSSGIFTISSSGSSSLLFQVKTASGIRALLVVGLRESSSEVGIQFRMNGIRLINHFGLSEESLRDSLPDKVEEMPSSSWQGVTVDEGDNWVGFRGYFSTTGEIDKLLTALTRNRGNF